MGIATEAGRPGVGSGARSRILGKARELGLSVPLDLERLAMARGCGYYERDLGPLARTAEGVPLSNAELAIALLVCSLLTDRCGYARRSRLAGGEKPVRRSTSQL